MEVEKVVQTYLTYLIRHKNKVKKKKKNTSVMIDNTFF